MKKLFIPFVLISIIIFASNVFAAVVCTQGINATELAYVRTRQGGFGGSEFVENYGGVITDTFRLPFNWTPRFKSAWWARVCVGAEVALSNSDKGFNISFVRNEQTLDYAPSYLMMADRIEIEPPSGEEPPEPSEGEEEEKEKVKEKLRKNEWIGEGGSFDSPPIANVSESFITKLCNRGQQKYIYSSYGKNKPCTVSGKPCDIMSGTCDYYSGIKQFSTEKEKISSIPELYTASNGFTAYVIPFGGLKTEAYGGVQFFKTRKGALECKISCNGPLSQFYSDSGITVPIHEAKDGNREYWYVDIEEAAKKCENVANAKPYIGCYDKTAYYLYVDKLFFPDTMEAVQADWLIRVYDRVQSKAGDTYLIFQLPVAMATGIPPQVDFNYEIVDITGEEIIVSFTPKASDPDGQITSFSWNFGDGTKKVGESLIHRFKPGYYTVVLTVADSDGLKTKKLRTIKLTQEE
jgi:chitodextrinase